MIQHETIAQSDLVKLIKQKQICFGGNQQLKIYGSLRCVFGKRMKIKNRVFFLSEDEALRFGFRPCGHCMKEEYRKWKEAYKSESI
jgi:methylphosphotriester-DNA--protein-cysteine methyltransferase